ncbi:MAG: hypothetical protein ACTHQQ_22355 [Solirubrobacteraceae bacterium]
MARQRHRPEPLQHAVVPRQSLTDAHVPQVLRAATSSPLPTFSHSGLAAAPRFVEAEVTQENKQSAHEVVFRARSAEPISDLVDQVPG